MVVKFVVENIIHTTFWLLVWYTFTNVYKDRGGFLIKRNYETHDLIFSHEQC